MLDRCPIHAAVFVAALQFSALLWPPRAKSGILFLHGGQREPGIPEPHEPGHTREHLNEVRATNARVKKSGPLSPPCPNRSRWRAARSTLVDAQATTPGGAPKERTRGRAATGRAEQAELVLKSPGEKEHGAQWSVPRLWKRSFCSSRQDRNKTVSGAGDITEHQLMPWSFDFLCTSRSRWIASRRCMSSVPGPQKGADWCRGL